MSASITWPMPLDAWLARCSQEPSLWLVVCRHAWRHQRYWWQRPLWSVPGCRSRRASRFPQVECPIYRHCVAILAEPKSSNISHFASLTDNKQLSITAGNIPTARPSASWSCAAFASGHGEPRSPWTQRGLHAGHRLDHRLGRPHRGAHVI